MCLFRRDFFPQALEASGWRLRHLDISDCPGLTDASLRAVGERCGVLESFSLGMCPLLSTGAIQEVGGGESVGGGCRRACCVLSFLSASRCELSCVLVESVVVVSAPCSKSWRRASSCMVDTILVGS